MKIPSGSKRKPRYAGLVRRIEAASRFNRGGISTLKVRHGTDAVSGASLIASGIASDPERAQSRARDTSGPLQAAANTSSRRQACSLPQAGQTGIVTIAFCPASSPKVAATGKVKCAPVAGHLACGGTGM